jgi:hypothetical protein
MGGIMDELPAEELLGGVPSELPVEELRGGHRTEHPAPCPARHSSAAAAR